LKPTYQGNCIKSSSIDDSLSWKAHIEQMMSKLNTACFVIRTIQAIISLETLRMIYFAYIHSIIRYGIIFWGNQSYCDKIFKIQKRVIRIITSSRPRDSCRELFKNLEILPLYSQYTLNINICCKKQTIISYKQSDPQYSHKI